MHFCFALSWNYEQKIKSNLWDVDEAISSNFGHQKNSDEAVSSVNFGPEDENQTNYSNFDTEICSTRMKNLSVERIFWFDHRLERVHRSQAKRFFTLIE